MPAVVKGEDESKVILLVILATILYFAVFNEGRRSGLCEARGGEIVTVGGDDRANDPGVDYCQFPNGGRVQVDDLDR